MGARGSDWFEGLELAAFDAYWTVCETHFDRIAAAALPEGRHVVSSLADPGRRSELRQELRQSLAVVRGAIRSGDWAPFVARLEQRGASMAKVGVNLDEWIEIVRLSQRHAVPELVAAHGHDPLWLGAAIAAMLDFWGRSIRIARREYERTREAIAQGDRDALRRSERLFRALVETSADAVSLGARDGTILYSGPASRAILGQPPEAFLGRKVFEFVVPEQLDQYRKGWQACLDQPGVRLRSEFAMRAADGRLVLLETVRTNLLDDPNLGAVVSLVRDITEQRAVEEQLRQSHKLEAIGNLAGGVAHDFNNLLTVILGCCDLALRDLPAGNRAGADIQEIRRAGERAASLTRQLLAFARKQVLDPRIVSLSNVVAGMEGLIRRLTGEDIDLAILPAPTLGNVKADVSQIEQVLMNLVVNARDAMPEGGRLVIETRDVDLDATAAGPLDLSPGPRVLLAVSDSGVGMDRETLSHVFEPFYTTKGERGTGLGLATVFGIVHQSGGAIAVDSEPGRGTTFRVYLPRTAEPNPVANPPIDLTTLQGSETLLLVDDEDAVRQVVHGILRRHGYDVLEASHPGEAILVAEQHRGPIHMLLTDVVMPKMTGRKLAERLAPSRPEMKVLYMSGYTEDSIVYRGVLDTGIAFLPKPVTPDALLRTVREVLDAPRLVEPAPPKG